MRTLLDLARRLGKGKYWDSAYVRQKPATIIQGCASLVAKVKDGCEGIFCWFLEH